MVCQANHPAIKATRHLESTALSEADTLPCLWLRGLLPLSLLPAPPVPLEVPLFTLGIFNDIENQTLDLEGARVYLDESGGAHTDNPDLRRAGWAVVVLDNNLRLKGAAFSGVEGDGQTQIQAAMWALLFVLLRTVGDLTVLPDCVSICLTGGRKACGQNTFPTAIYGARSTKPGKQEEARSL